MAEQYIMINDIIEEQYVRMQNLKRYYPFFILMDTTFSQYKEGRYQNLDMGYITLASLRFFINENNFNNNDISYEEYERFLSVLLRRDFELEIVEDEERELIMYIFDKLKNDGKAFEFSFYDPASKNRKISRVKLIDSKISNGRVLYHITSEAIEFYLDTKEVKEESNISIQQLLLEKLITAKNFKGGIDVVKRINSEVTKLIYKKEEVINLLSHDVFEGAKASEEYMETVATWFDEEQKLFVKNKELIEVALSKTDNIAIQGEEGKANSSLEDIHKLEVELKKTIDRHGELINQTIELQNIADQIIERAKLRKLRPVFDFQSNMNKLREKDNVAMMDTILQPLFMPKIVKSFSFNTIDNMLTLKGDGDEKGEKIVRERAEIDYKYEDELEEDRIADNFSKMFYELLDQIYKKGVIDQREYNGILEIKFGEDIFINGDYYSYMAHLAQKNRYDINQIIEKQDTFLEGLVAPMLEAEENIRFKGMVFEVVYIPEAKIEHSEHISTSSVRYERKDI